MSRGGRGELTHIVRQAIAAPHDVHIRPQQDDIVLIEIAPGKTVVVAENKAAKRSMITDDFAWDTSGLGGNVGAATIKETPLINEILKNDNNNVDVDRYWIDGHYRGDRPAA